MAGKKERYSGVEHGIEDLVDKSKVEIVVQRQANYQCFLHSVYLLCTLFCSPVCDLAVLLA